MIVRNLQFYTNDLEAQYNFYIGKLGFKLRDRWNTAFSFQAGKSLVCILKALDEPLNPIHFAFALQKTTIEDSLTFLSGKVDFIPNRGNKSLVVDFPSWEAKSLYFYDGDNNIVEFIIRDKDTQSDTSTFSFENIKSVCEVGIPYKNCQEFAQQLKDGVNLETYKGANKHFQPMGDSEGLLIVVEREKKKWFPPNEVVKSAKLKVTIQNRGYIKDILCDKEEVSLV